MTRDDHLAWCKQRAVEYLDSGDLANALGSFKSDLGKHPETHPLAGLFLDMENESPTPEENPMPVTIDIPTTSPSADWLGPDWDPDTAEPDDRLTVRRSLRWGPVYRTVEVDERLGELAAEVAQLTEANTKLAGDSGTLDERERALDAQILGLERRRADVMAQGQAAADGMVTRARTVAEQTVADAKRRAAMIEADAQRRAADVVRAARAVADEMIEGAKAQAVDINPIPDGGIEAEAGWVLEQDERVRTKALAQQTAATAALALLGGDGPPRVAVALHGVEPVELGRPPELTAGKRAAKAGTASGS
jgi:hypothetical protein